MLLLLVVVPCVLTWREVRQERLNHDLIAAIKRHERQAVLSLLRAGADAATRDLPLDSRPVWRIILDRLRGVASPSSNGPTALLMVLQRSEESGKRTFNPAETHLLVRVLIDRGADVNATDADDDTPLRLALDSDDYASLVLLLKHGAFVNARSRSGITALIQAGGWGDVEEIDLLVKAGADLNAQDSEGDTALHCAVGNDCVENVRLLLKRHAAFDLADRVGETPLTCAKHALETDAKQGLVTDYYDQRWREIVQMLEKAGAKK